MGKAIREGCLEPPVNGHRRVTERMNHRVADIVFMPLIVNLRHIETQDLHVEGEIPAAELDLGPEDEVVRVASPLGYDLEVQQFEGGLLLQGRLTLPLACECVRCLKPFAFKLELTDWACHVPLEEEEAAPVVNDCVDLTPYLREDILLEFPQHPLCSPECRGLPKTAVGEPEKARGAAQAEPDASAWSELDKLKL